jgi:transcription elongation factor Elf1
MKCPYCEKPRTSAGSTRSIDVETSWSICDNCEILFEVVLIEGKLVQAYARKIIKD